MNIPFYTNKLYKSVFIFSSKKEEQRQPEQEVSRLANGTLDLIYFSSRRIGTQDEGPHSL